MITRKNEKGRGTAGIRGLLYAVKQDVKYVVEMDAGLPIIGCMDSDALNYNADANTDDGSCEYDFTDLNGDGDVNILDIIAIINIILEN